MTEGLGENVVGLMLDGLMVRHPEYTFS